MARLLVVDDVAENRNILARRFARQGFDVAEADDGTTALEMISRARFDAVLLDIIMPKLDGFEVLKRIRTDHSPAGLPVIMVTAKTESTDVVQALELGANDYITKPVDFQVALARVRTQLARKQAEEELRQANEELAQRIRELEAAQGAAERGRDRAEQGRRPQPATDAGDHAEFWAAGSDHDRSLLAGGYPVDGPDLDASLGDGPDAFPGRECGELSACYASLVEAGKDLLTRAFELEREVQRSIPAIPDALLARPSDAELGLSRPLKHADGRLWFGYEQAEILRGRLLRTPERAFEPALHARMEEIIAAWDEWRADVEWVRERVGLTAVNQEIEGNAEARRDLLARIALSAVGQVIDGEPLPTATGP